MKFNLLDNQHLSKVRDLALSPDYNAPPAAAFHQEYDNIPDTAVPTAKELANKPSRNGELRRIQFPLVQVALAMVLLVDYLFPLVDWKLQCLMLASTDIQVDNFGHIFCEKTKLAISPNRCRTFT